MCSSGANALHEVWGSLRRRACGYPLLASLRLMSLLTWRNSTSILVHHSLCIPLSYSKLLDSSAAFPPRLGVYYDQLFYVYGDKAG